MKRQKEIISLKNFQTLKKTSEFRKIYKNSEVFHTKYFILFYKKTSYSKTGFVASKKIGNAVKRNRAKRVLKALFLESIQKHKSGTYVFVAKHSIVLDEFFLVKQVFLKLQTKLSS